MTDAPPAPPRGSSEQAEAPPAPSGPRRAAVLVDEAVFRVERALVTLAAAVMTVTITLDIVYRAFASGESKIAEKLATVYGWFGGELDAAGRAFLRDRVSPAVLVALTFGAGWGIFAAIRRRQGRPRPAWQGALAGVATLAGGWAFVQVLLHVPSKWVCLGLLEAACAGYLAYTIRRRDRGGAALAVAIGALGGWGCTYLRQDYIWSQELSLILLAWLAFLGGSMATRTQRHITVDAFARLVPAQAAPWTRALGLLATTLFCLYVAVLAYEHVFGPRGAIASGEIRPATGIPAWTITLAVFVSFVLMTVRFGALTVDAFLRPRAPERTATH